MKDIIRRFKKTHSTEFFLLPDKIAI